MIRIYNTHSDWDHIYDNDPDKVIYYRPGKEKKGGLNDEDSTENFPCVGVDQTSIRLPQEALVRIFGIGPWIWQRWACLQLELVLRFCQDGQEQHRNDFANLEICNYALELWTAWLYHKKNTAFRELYETVGPSGQEELLRHVMDPFTVMHSVIHDEERWDFQANEDSVSVFLHTAMLGAGFLDALVVIFLQVRAASLDGIVMFVN